MISNIRKIKEDKMFILLLLENIFNLEDSYISVAESITHAGFANNVKQKYNLIDSETVTKNNVAENLKRYRWSCCTRRIWKPWNRGKIQTIQICKRK